MTKLGRGRDGDHHDPKQWLVAASGSAESYVCDNIAFPSISLYVLFLDEPSPAVAEKVTYFARVF